MTEVATTTILFCRHGETEWNHLRKFQGTIDIPLNDEGREQASAIAETMFSKGIAAVWTSPLLRAHSTAKRVADRIGLPLRIDVRLKERNLGILQGLGYNVIKKSYPQIWAAWKAFQPLPQEAQAESDEDITVRMEDAIFDMGAKHPGQTIAVVGHAGTLRVVFKEGGAVGNASITTVVVGPGRRWRLIRSDEQLHLPKPSLKLGDLNNPEEKTPRTGLPVTTIMLCRHGESVGNASRKFQGSIDLSLSIRGHMQAALVGNALKPYDVQALWTSPLSRARDSAIDIGRIIGVPAVPSERLGERNLGLMQGRPYDYVKATWPNTWKAWKSYLPLPDEVKAETRPSVVDRLESVFYELADKHPGKTVAVVIHGANGRCLLKRSIGNGSITTIVVGPGRTWHVNAIGDATHLPEELAQDAIKASKL